MPPTRSSKRTQSRVQEDTEASETSSPVASSSRPAYMAYQTPAVNRLRHAPRVRESLTRSGILSNDITSRADQVSGLAANFLRRLYEGRGLTVAWSAFNDCKVSNIFPPHAPPLPTYDEIENALHPDHDLDRDALFRAVRLSNLSTFLFSIYSPETASDTFLPFDLEEENEEDVRGLSEGQMTLRARVRRRNYVWEKAWKMFWRMVVPEQKRDSERAMTLWLDFATQIHLRYQCPSPTDDPSDALPEISGILDNDFFSQSALLRFGLWTLPDDAGEKDIAKKARASNRWEDMAEKRIKDLREMTFEEATEEFDWEDFRDRLLAWVKKNVLMDEDTSIFTPPKGRRPSLAPLSYRSISPLKPFPKLPGPLRETIIPRQEEEEEKQEDEEQVGDQGEEEKEEEERSTDQGTDKEEEQASDQREEEGEEEERSTDQDDEEEERAIEQDALTKVASVDDEVFRFNPAPTHAANGVTGKKVFKFAETQDDAVQIGWDSQTPEKTPVPKRKVSGKGKGKARMIEESEEESLRSDTDAQSSQSYMSEDARAGGAMDLDTDDNEDPDGLYLDDGQTDPPPLQDVKPAPSAPGRTTRAMSRAQSVTPAPAPATKKGRKRTRDKEDSELVVSQPARGQPTKKARRTNQPPPTLTETESEHESEAETLATQASNRGRPAPGTTPSPAPSSQREDGEPTPRPGARPSAPAIVTKDEDEAMEEKFDLGQLLSPETEPPRAAAIPSQSSQRSKKAIKSRRDPRRINEDSATHDVDHDGFFEAMDAHEKEQSSKSKGKERAKEVTIEPSPPPASSSRAAQQPAEPSRPARSYRIDEAGPSRQPASSRRSTSHTGASNIDWHNPAFMGDDAPMAAQDDYDAQKEAMRENGYGDYDLNTEEEEEEEEENGHPSEDGAFATDSSDSEAALRRIRASNKAIAARRRQQTPDEDTEDESDTQSSTGSSQGRVRLDRPAKKPRPLKKPLLPQSSQPGSTAKHLRKSRKIFDPDNDPCMLEDGQPLKPFRDLDAPIKYQPDIPRARYQAIWTDELSWLMYRTVQKCPAWVRYPLRIVWYLHGADGRLGNEFAGFDMAQLKSRMEEITNIRLHGGHPVEGNARAFVKSAAVKKSLGWELQREKRRVQAAINDKLAGEESERLDDEEEEEDQASQKKPSRPVKNTKRIARAPKSTKGRARKVAQSPDSPESEDDGHLSNAEAGPSNRIGNGEGMTATGTKILKDIQADRDDESEIDSESTVVERRPTRSSGRLATSGNRRPCVEIPRSQNLSAKKAKQTSPSKSGAKDTQEGEEANGNQLYGADDLRDELDEDDVDVDQQDEEDAGAGEAAELPPAGQHAPTVPDSSGEQPRVEGTPYTGSLETANKEVEEEEPREDEEQEEEQPTGQQQAEEVGGEQAASGQSNASAKPRTLFGSFFGRS
ncbi:hypothetical protein L202_05190 [Cryptococcus amylolentus CBS 6039]|uniref:Uncharacterized protein n=1 Tax=Cryptococcus amylolentus CBS 6039 TaxID=1295533 RepID=A0A1E3HJK2_9TREE|nr:hypothetical protein L202_05190 [Cryptococcus amylolentus CBS 6039]ODN76523.1 hypothetical protein L202_05190 [Cryptococcus amylolentus CBS 6039]